MIWSARAIRYRRQKICARAVTCRYYAANLIYILQIVLRPIRDLSAAKELHHERGSDLSDLSDRSDLSDLSDARKLVKRRR